MLLVYEMVKRHLAVCFSSEKFQIQIFNVFRHHKMNAKNRFFLMNMRMKYSNKTFERNIRTNVIGPIGNKKQPEKGGGE